MLVVVMEQLSAALFCAFIVLFVIPGTLVRVVYTVPNLALLAVRRQIRWLAVFYFLIEVFLWSAIATGIYALTYLFNKEAFYLISTAPIAAVCWIVGGIFVVVQFIMYGFFTNKAPTNQGYVRNITADYFNDADSFIAYAQADTEEKAREVLVHHELTYTERKLLKNKARL